MADGNDAPKLTIKQEAFAQFYLECGNASEAYRRAYDADDMQEQTIWRKAVEVLQNGKVAARLEILQAEARERHAVTIDTITKMLKEDRDLAREQGQPSAAVSAVMGLAKIHGLVVDKSNNENRNTGTVTVSWSD
jgi:phage terminase small subunit